MSQVEESLGYILFYYLLSFFFCFYYLCLLFSLLISTWISIMSFPISIQAMKDEANKRWKDGKIRDHMSFPFLSSLLLSRFPIFLFIFIPWKPSFVSGEKGVNSFQGMLLILPSLSTSSKIYKLKELIGRIRK